MMAYTTYRAAEQFREERRASFRRLSGSGFIGFPVPGWERERRVHPVVIESAAAR